jgi:hypothetical protein
MTAVASVLLDDALALQGGSIVRRAEIENHGRSLWEWRGQPLFSKTPGMEKWTEWRKHPWETYHAGSSSINRERSSWYSTSFLLKSYSARVTFFDITATGGSTGEVTVEKVSVEKPVDAETSASPKIVDWGEANIVAHLVVSPVFSVLESRQHELGHDYRDAGR